MIVRGLRKIPFLSIEIHPTNLFSSGRAMPYEKIDLTFLGKSRRRHRDRTRTAISCGKPRKARLTDRKGQAKANTIRDPAVFPDVPLQCASLRHRRVLVPLSYHLYLDVLRVRPAVLWPAVLITLIGGRRRSPATVAAGEGI